MKIGIDGGGTKTELILLDPAGNVLARHIAPGCNPNVAGPEHAFRQLNEAINTLLALRRSDQPPSPITRTLLCMAGAPAFWQEVARRLGGLGLIETCDDSRPVLELATQGGPGLVVHGGTGSFVAARAPDGARHYAGGLGWRFGDPGSGYDLGRRTVARALLELQGWALPTRLTTLVRDHAGLNEAPEITRAFYQNPEPNRLISSLAPAVLRLASEGDPEAQRIVTDSCSDLLRIVEAVLTKCFPGWHRDNIVAGLSGPVLTHPASLAVLQKRSPINLRPLTEAPIEGVRRLLMAR